MDLPRILGSGLVGYLLASGTMALFRAKVACAPDDCIGHSLPYALMFFPLLQRFALEWAIAVYLAWPFATALAYWHFSERRKGADQNDGVENGDRVGPEDILRCVELAPAPRDVLRPGVPTPFSGNGSCIRSSDAPASDAFLESEVLVELQSSFALACHRHLRELR